MTATQHWPNGRPSSKI